MFVHASECKEEILDNGVKRRIKGWIDDLMVVELRWNAGMIGEVHTHPHRQCGYVVKGRFEADVEGEKEILTDGDCFYVEANQPHGLTCLEDGSVLLDIFTPHREDFAAALNEK